MIDEGLMVYKECDTCAAKPGSPTLCSGCLNNRTYIGRLERKLEFYEKIIKALT